jgi:hypothetical protein
LSSSFSSIFVTTTSDLLGCHDLDIGGTCPFFLVIAIVGYPLAHDLNIHGPCPFSIGCNC